MKAKFNHMEKLRISLIIVFIISCLVSFSQNQTDSIMVEKRMGTVFIQNGKMLKVRQLMEITKSNPDAYAKMKVANTNNGAATAFAIGGGFLIGWPLGTALAGGDPNWVLVGVGAGLIAISIPFSIGFSKNAKEAVSIYNRGLIIPETTKVKLNFGISNNGIGIRVAF